MKKNIDKKQNKNNKKKKVLLGTLIPVGVLAVAAAITAPIVVTQLNTNKTNVKLSSLSDKGVSIKSYDVNVNKKSTITLELPKDTEVKQLFVWVGGQQILEKYFRVEDDKVIIKSEAMTNTDVSICVLLKTKYTISLNKTSTSLLADETEQLIATVTPEGTQVTWESSDEETVSVDDNGLIKGLKEGQATITATCGDKTTTCTVDVAEIKLTINPTSIKINEGETSKVTTSVTPAKLEVTLKSDDPLVAGVADNGNVYGRSAGYANIIATVGNKTATCLVEVDPVATNSTVIIDEDGTEYEAELETMCTDNEKTDIVGINQETNEEKTWPRSTFNRQVIIGENLMGGGSPLTAIGNNFLANCPLFNNNGHPLSIPSNIKTIGTNFLYANKTFDQTIFLPSSLTSIGDYFMTYCTSFNNGGKTLVLPKIEAISNGFLNLDYSFNQDVVISSATKTIGNNFMYCCSSQKKKTGFSSSIIFEKDSNLTSIGNYYLGLNPYMTKDIILPKSLKTIGKNFLSNSMEKSTEYPTFKGTISFETSSMLTSIDDYCMVQNAGCTFDLSNVDVANLNIDNHLNWFDGKYDTVQILVKDDTDKTTLTNKLAGVDPNWYAISIKVSK